MLSATPALADEAALIRAADEITDLVCDGGYTNVLIEVANEADIPRWPQEIIKPARSHELVARVQSRSKGRVKTPAGRLLVSTSFATPAPIPERLLQTADYVLYHGNGAGHAAGRARSRQADPGDVGLSRPAAADQ